MRFLAPAAAALLIAAPAGAQTWTPVESPPEGMAAVSARWPSGQVALARCGADGRLDLIFSLADSVAQRTVVVQMTLADGLHDPSETPEEEEGTELWRLSAEGDLLFARQPARLSRFLAGGETAQFTLKPADGPPQAHEITAPAHPEVLLAVVSACGHPTVVTVTGASVVEHPDWIERPTGDDLAQWYPYVASRNGVDGSAIIQCKVTLDGRAEDCIVESETPEGMNFGAATVAIATRFRFRPTQVDGVAVDEAIVRIPIRWMLG